MNDLSLLDKIIYEIFTQKRVDGSRIPRNSSLAHNVLKWYTNRKFENYRKNFTKYTTETMEDYFIDFTKENAILNRPFVIDLNKNQNVDLQIVHPSFIDNISNNSVTESFGYVIHLPFGDSDQEVIELDNFKKSVLYKSFRKEDNSETLTYYFHASSNIDLLVNTLKVVLTEIKGFYQNDKFNLGNWHPEQ